MSTEAIGIGIGIDQSTEATRRGAIPYVSSYYVLFLLSTLLWCVMCVWCVFYVRVSPLINLDRCINLCDEHEAREVSNRTGQYKECKAYEEHVTKE